MAFLELDTVVKRYARVEVLKGISIDLDEGGFLVLVGPSGCGKSTLLNAIAGLDAITSGEIRIAGHVVNDLKPSARDIAMVFQSYALYPNMTVAGNVAFPLEMRGVAKAERDAAVKRVAATLQIEHLLGRRPAQLSGGQRQRVAMGRALVRDPKIFLFDEPLSNLDAKLRVDMRAEIRRLHQATGRTTVYVTHDQVEAMTLATKIAVLKDGLLQQVGTPSEIYNHPANLFVADFMGSPPMNLLTATVVDNGATVEIAREGEGPIRLPLPVPARPGEVILGIRPEAVTDPAGADPESRALTPVDALVARVEPTGADTYVGTRAAGREILARMRGGADVTPGARKSFVFDLTRAVLFEPGSGARLAGGGAVRAAGGGRDGTRVVNLARGDK